jgi:hypothetical protein
VENSLLGRVASSSLPAGKALTTDVRRAGFVKEGWSSQQLSNVGTHANTRISDAEELIDETANSNEDDTDEPSTESARRDGGIVMIIDNSAHFSIRRVLHQRVTMSSAGIQHETLTITTRAASTLSSS